MVAILWTCRFVTMCRIDENGVSDRFLKRSCSVLFRCERGSVNVKKRIKKEVIKSSYGKNQIETYRNP